MQVQEVLRYTEIAPVPGAPSYVLGIINLRVAVAPLPDKIQQLEQRDPHNVTFTQAAKLVGMGASVAELTESCGLTQAEAELMSKLHRGN